MTATPAALSSLRLGDVAITFLPDGVHHCEAVAQYPQSPAELWDGHPEVLDATGMLVMSIGAILIQAPDRTVLVDVGIGPKTIDIATLTGGMFKGDLIGGQLPESFRQAGVSPADIDAIVFSHLHVDHVGWVGDPAGGHFFPNARYVIDESEWDHWSKPEQIELGQGATAWQLALLGERLDTVTGETPLADCVTTLPTPGHTPGHTSVVIRSGGGAAVVLGDAIHCPVEFQQPSMCFVFDHDADAAAQSRSRIRSILSGPDSWFVGGHFPDHIFGQLKKSGEVSELVYP
jgi:glyoxylase-like metal-dependent hydrolase (beta-lactamase superfamily II)